MQPVRWAKVVVNWTPEKNIRKWCNYEISKERSGTKQGGLCPIVGTAKRSGDSSVKAAGLSERNTVAPVNEGVERSLTQPSDTQSAKNHLMISYAKKKDRVEFENNRKYRAVFAI